MDELTTRQAAEMLGVSLRTIQLWVEAGALAAWKTPGGHRRIARASVEQLQARGKPRPGNLEASQPPVLVVEDNPGLRKLYQAAFKRWNIPLLLAANGFEGLLKVGEFKPGMVVSDLQMPGMDGFAMIRALLANDELASMRVVVVTGLTEKEINNRGGLPGDLPVLRKPVPLERLRALIEELSIFPPSGGSAS